MTKLVSEINAILQQTKSYIWSTQKDNCYWLYPPFLGPSFVCQYYLALGHLDCLSKSKFNVESLKTVLVESQLSDGGWLQVPEPNIQSGHLDSTIFNYWFLKASKSLPINHETMKRAREFILSHGGLNSCSTMTKVWLCLFGQLDWSEIATIPLFVFRNDGIVHKATFVRNIIAQWVYPHLLPIAYLRHFRTHKDLGPDFDLSELNFSSKKSISTHKSTPRSKPSSDVENLVNKIKEIRRPLGTYGCYTVSTYFSLMSLQDWYENHPLQSADELAKFAAQLNKSVGFLDELSLESDSSSYLGVVDDGRWWDTLLITVGLLEAGEEKEALVPVIKHFLQDGVQKCGGIAYGLEFEYCPDTDDTGMMVCILAKYFHEEFNDALKKANNWLISMQNHDGGFGAFAKGVVDWWPVKLMAGAFQNSAELFDDSSVDVTAHILEGWALSGYTHKDKHVRKAIEFIKGKQTEFGAWEGRWGCNYIYSVGAVVSAVTKFPDFRIEGHQWAWVLESVNWLLTCQNEDGGFGESTQSYTDRSWIGKGKSTPTQTSWALLALIEFYHHEQKFSNAVERAVEFLRDSFENGKWVDPSSVGTGHRKIIFMQYPVYALAWPLIALSRYTNLKIKSF